MGNWKVFYADWQTECRGTPFSVGDEVSRALLPKADDDLLGGGRDEELLSSFAAPVEHVRDDEEGALRPVRPARGVWHARSLRCRA
ncbi:DUF6578 domain-containing protein [Streptomyces sp. TP-A0356]|uniref:DUF6578 domain-containing protein n=1 Tax=Streptomyces sp. TP-A0356 TaxID=1359208 RepID=UPI0006E14250|nr:DUF6578 domain-containing protein [Streptomyces sp. TP-A0356]